MLIEVGDLKMAREKLATIQHQINQTQTPGRAELSTFLEGLIREIDYYRPLGADGKHGDNHTNFCGCDLAPPGLTFDEYVAFIKEHYKLRFGGWS